MDINEICLEDALAIKSAELWLKLGESKLALQELDHLPDILKNHPSALKARLAAVRATSPFKQAG